MKKQLIHGNTVKNLQNLGISFLLTRLDKWSKSPISIEYKMHGLNQIVFGA